MSDKEKIQQILESKHLTAAQFADTIGIPRSSISHILSERNRLSMDIARKVVKQFPEITFEWLCNEEFTSPSIQSSLSNFNPKSFLAASNTSAGRTTDTKKKKAASRLERAEEFITTEAKHVVKMIVFYSDNTWQEIL